MTSITTRMMERLSGMVLALFCASTLWAAGGSLSGVLEDPTGAVISGGKLTLVNQGTKAEFTTTSDSRGFYSFPALPVGKYDLTIDAVGFKSQKKPISASIPTPPLRLMRS